MARPRKQSRSTPASAPSAPGLVCVGLVTDPHYADKADRKDRCYRWSLAKLQQAVEHFKRAGVDFIVEVGDFIDSGASIEEETGFAKRIDKEFRGFKGDRHYVLGNHCVSLLTKNEFLRACRGGEPYHAFDHKGIRFIVLDACYRPDEQPYGRNNFDWRKACIPQAECEWLDRTLARTKGRAVVFVHQRIDADDDYGLTNGPIVRGILKRSGKVSVVVQGHYHPGDYRQLGGIHCITLSAMVTGPGLASNAYAILEVRPDGSANLEGFGRQKSYTLK